MASLAISVGETPHREDGGDFGPSITVGLDVACRDHLPKDLHWDDDLHGADALRLQLSEFPVEVHDKLSVCVGHIAPIFDDAEKLSVLVFGDHERRYLLSHSPVLPISIVAPIRAWREVFPAEVS